MEFLIVIIFVIFALLGSFSKKNKRAGKDTPVPNRPRQGQAVPNRPRPPQNTAARTAANAGNRMKKAASEWTRQLYEADKARKSDDRDLHYDQSSLDYCDSDVPASKGISFRDLPPGADELAYLRKWNAGREKQLEQSLESRG